MGLGVHALKTRKRSQSDGIRMSAPIPMTSSNAVKVAFGALWRGESEL
jgi:hypothetical protein